MQKIWKTFTAAPHRVMFFGGVVQILLSILWWTLELSTRYVFPEHSIPWPIFSSAIHGWMMLFGLMPFFFFGFLMTTFPRWMAGNEIPVSRYVLTFVLMFAGVLVFYLGLFIGSMLVALANVLLLAGWGVGLSALLRVLLETRPGDKRHPVVLLIAFSFGWLSLASFLLWQLSDIHAALQFALRAGLWWFVLPVFVTVAHRMVPFFTANALQLKEVPRPFWAWWVILLSSITHGWLEFTDMSSWLWLCDIPMAIGVLSLSYLWGFRRSFQNPMLAVLHVGFAWIGVAMLMFAIQSLWLITHLGTDFIMGMAPLHALTVGGYATLIIGMGTRVTLGHSGMPFKVDIPIKLMFVGAQLVALVRIAADFLPSQSGWFYLFANLLWLACFGAWAWRFLPVYWHPRTDGQRG